MRWLAPAVVAAAMLSVGAASGGPTLMPWAVSSTFGLWALRRSDWSTARWRILVVPVAGAAAGVGIVHLGLPVWAAACSAVGLGLALLQLARCPIGPFLSAPVLPVLLDVRSWWHPVAVLVVTAVLAAVSAPPARTDGRWSATTVGVHATAVCCWLAAAAALGLPPVAVAPPLMVSCLEFVLLRARPDRTAIRRWLLLGVAAAAGAACLRWIPVPWVAGAVAVSAAAALCAAAKDAHPPAFAVALVPFVAGLADPVCAAVLVITGVAGLQGVAWLSYAALRRRRGPDDVDE